MVDWINGTTCPPGKLNIFFENSSVCALLNSGRNIHELGQNVLRSLHSLQTISILIHSQMPIVTRRFPGLLDLLNCQ